MRLESYAVTRLRRVIVGEIYTVNFRDKTCQVLIDRVDNTRKTVHYSIYHGLSGARKAWFDYGDEWVRRNPVKWGRLAPRGWWLWRKLVPVREGT